MGEHRMEDRVSSLVRLGVIVGVHGVRGQVRIKSFTHRPKDVAAYGPVSDDSGDRSWRLRVTGAAKGVVIGQLEGVTDRTAAEALKGTPLCVPRAALPPVDEEDEYYHADLIGLMARYADDSVFGRVTAVHDFGAGDMLEVRPQGGDGQDGKGAAKTVMIPFTRAAVPRVDLAAASLWVADLPGMLDSTSPEGEDLSTEDASAEEGVVEDPAHG